MDIFLRILNFILASIPNWLGFPTELIKKKKERKDFQKNKLKKNKEKKKNRKSVDLLRSNYELQQFIN
jgi:hypothetical protein